MFRVLFRERGIKAVFSCWDFWVPNRAEIPRICCGRCRPTVVHCCLFVFIWGFVHLFFATSVGIFLFCVVSCLGHCMHMRETLGRAWVNSTNLLRRLPLFICLSQPVLRELGHAIRSSGPLTQVQSSKSSDDHSKGWGHFAPPVLEGGYCQRLFRGLHAV